MYLRWKKYIKQGSGTVPNGCRSKCNRPGPATGSINFHKPIPMQRLEFLDIMKGLIMFLLAAESCQVYASLYNYPLTGVGSTVIGQFYHHPWHGLNAWDLVQPSFMLIAGTALYLSYAKRASKGISWAQNFKQVL